MQTLMPRNVDCFHFQYNTCPRGKCSFQHRERAKQSNVICEAWRQRKHCRNKQCNRKHLDKEAMKMFFLCQNERHGGTCSLGPCPNYHEKTRSLQIPSILLLQEADKVPVKEKSQWKKKKHVAKDSLITENLVRSSTAFIRESVKFIMSNMKSGKLTEEKATCYLKEILHSVFFLGHINMPKIHPQDILEENFYQNVRKKFPDVFEKYTTHLPKRPPYSVLLDTVVETTEDRGVDAVLDQLVALNSIMQIPRAQDDGKKCGNKMSLQATVVSFCYFEDFVTSQRTKFYFGVSVACEGWRQRRIFIDLSCVMAWNRNVALAVCLVENGNMPVLLPQYVHSAAFHVLSEREAHCVARNTGLELPPSGNDESALEDPAAASSQALELRDSRTTFGYYPKPPCVKCVQLFPNVNFSPKPSENKPAYWECGNCAECEAVSKLLNAERSVDMRVQVLSDNSIYMTVERLSLAPVVFSFWEALIEQRRQRLAQNLTASGFELGQYFQFYSPIIAEDTSALVPHGR